jgi:hypothetical protein
VSAAPHFRTIHRAVTEQEQLQRAPELPVLAAVTNAVDLAIAVLRIQYPFLAGSTALEHVGEPVPIVLAEIVRLHAGALRSAIEKYRDVMAPFPDLPRDDLDDF